ncbi:hypothetical protein BYT27DRAFT_7109342 [Phlegmacium glaucopus]|nr:hypothetical protein BYT27DRAFT_7109342 [Phlegmacium glaucopus]
MSLVDLRVDLPAYARSLFLKVNASNSILQVKEEISRTCPGQPRPDGQRLIWRGRILADNETVDSLWKSEPRVVHLAVHPSAWSSSPPEIPQVAQPSLSPPPSESPIPPRNQITSRMESTGVPQPAVHRPTLAFIVYKHHKALAVLSPVVILHNELEHSPATMQAARSTALSTLQRNGWGWPSILDEEFPAPSEGGLVYESTVMEGKSYLRLCNSSESATPSQAHALRVLSVTFTILSMTLPAPPTSRSVQTQAMPIPPHVNQLLQQLGLPPLRVAPNQNANPIPGPNNPILPEIREINLRPFLATLMMLIVRTTLLLYFVAPTRKPIFGVLILLWMLYEIWQPIRNALRNGLGRNPQVPAEDRPDARAPQNPVEPNGNNDAQAAAPQPAANAAVLGRPVAFEAQADAILDGLANINIQEEEGILREAPGVPTVEPGLGHKISTFLALLMVTMHPAIWNRRRVALRRREGTIRTEANMRNSVPVEEGETDTGGQIREELRAQFNRRPGWIQRYIGRVVAEDWVDSD